MPELLCKGWPANLDLLILRTTMITTFYRRLSSSISTSILWKLPLLILCLFSWLSTPAQAHPLGNFTLNQYAGLQISSAQLQVDYVLDMAEIPAFQEIQKLDVDRDRQVDPDEIRDYPTRLCDQLRSDVVVHIDRQTEPILLATTAATVDFPPGVGGLATLRLTCQWHGPLPDRVSNSTLHIFNHIYPHRLGWREITVSSDDIPIHSDLDSHSLSHRLRNYPHDLLSSPLDQRDATIVLYPASDSTASPSSKVATSGAELQGRQGDVMTDLLSVKTMTPLGVIGALLLAFLWGGFHALTPGHGKTLVGAYLVGSRGTARHAIVLGLTTTLTHTSSIFILGAIALVASHVVITEYLYPWLSLLSGSLIVLVGVYLVGQRIRDSNHSHHHRDHHHHHHPGDHHHHSPPEPISWPGLLAIGFSGGILPCPSALLVMLGSITLGRIGFGLALVLAFSLGLAAVLTGIGLMFVYGRVRLQKANLMLPCWRGWSAVSALVVLLIGLGMTGRALQQIL